MMKITIATDNAAFEDDDMRPEVARLLRKIADQVESGQDDLPVERVVMDSSGNRVGSWSLA